VQAKSLAGSIRWENKEHQSQRQNGLRSEHLDLPSMLFSDDCF
jgi:hypothetical protein